MRKDPEGGALSSFLESANPKQRRAQSCRGEADLKKEPQGWERTGQGEDAPGHPPQADQAAASRQKEAKVKAAEREGREERKRRETADTPSSLNAQASQRCCQKGVGRGRASSGGNRKCCGGNKQGGHGRW